MIGKRTRSLDSNPICESLANLLLRAVEWKCGCQHALCPRAYRREEELEFVQLHRDVLFVCGRQSSWKILPISHFEQQRPQSCVQPIFLNRCERSCQSQLRSPCQTGESLKVVVVDLMQAVNSLTLDKEDELRDLPAFPIHCCTRASRGAWSSPSFPPASNPPTGGGNEWHYGVWSLQ